MPTVRILESAAEEAVEAAAWYEHERRGLGSDFFRALEAALDLLQEPIVPLTPCPGKVGAKGARRIILKRFPYDVVVIERATEVIVIAVAHHARKPGYWRERLAR